MSKRTSIYLKDDTAKLADASSRPLGEALHRGLLVKPLLIEENEQGGFTTHWYCEVPAEGIKYQVLCDHWLQPAGRWPIREVYEIKVTQEAQS